MVKPFPCAGVQHPSPLPRPPDDEAVLFYSEQRLCVTKFCFISDYLHTDFVLFNTQRNA